MTAIIKGRNGWQATTLFPMGPAKERHGDKVGERVLEIYTRKEPRGGIHSRAMVMLKRDGWSQHAIGLGAGGDYSRGILRAGVKCTEKAVRELHAAALLQADTIMAEAVAHYAQEKAAA